MGRRAPLAGRRLAEAAKAGPVEVAEVASWAQGPPVGVVRAGLAAGVAAGASGRAVERVGASPPAVGAQACHYCWHWGALGEAVAPGLQPQQPREARQGWRCP